MGAVKQTKKKSPRSASLNHPPAGAAKSLARGQSRQQRGRGGGGGHSRAILCTWFWSSSPTPTNEKTKEPKRVWLPNGATTLLPVNLRVEGGEVLCRARRQEQGGAVLPPWERTYNAAPAAVGRRREEETHTLK